MEFAPASWCTWKCSSLNQAIRILTYCDLEISPSVTQLGVTRLKKTSFLYLLNWRRGGEVVVRFSLCGASLDDWTNNGSVDVFSRMIV